MLVGRAREVSQLGELLESARGGEGALALIAGEPGIGKTRLASEIARRARELGMRVSWGHAWEAGGAPALWPWHEALEGLATSFPDPVAMGDPGEARFALFREVARRLGAIGPCAIVLEDLHAADRSTLMLLELVAKQLRTMPVLLIGTYRDLEASRSEEISGALARAGRSGLTLALARLDEADVTAMIRASIEDADDRTTNAIYDATLGNPLFVSEMVRELRAGGPGSRIPLGVREIIRQRLALVSDETRHVLEIAAVFGVELALPDVARVADRAAAVLDEAARAGLVIANGDRYRFAHALYRESLFHELPRERRYELHRAAAQALIARGGPAVEIAHHLLESGPTAASEAIEVAIRAAHDAVAMFAFEDAAALLARAQTAIPSGPQEKTLRCRLAIALGEVRLRSGDSTGRAICVEAAQAARELGAPELLAMAALAYGTMFMMGGVDPVLVAMLEEALAGLAGDTALRARAMARLAAARQPSAPADRPRDIELGFAAVELARRVATPADLLEVIHAASGVMYAAVAPATRLQLSREQEQLAEQLGNMPLLMAARTRLALDHLEMCDLAAHAALATTYEQMAERLGPLAGPWRVPLMRSMQAIAAGDYATSERLQAEAATLDHGQPRARRALAFHRICFLRAAERHAELRASIAELRGLWLQMPYGNVIGEPRVLSTLARIGAEDEVRDLLRQLPRAAFEEEINTFSLAEAMWLTGDATHAATMRELLRLDRWGMMYWFDCEIVEGPVTRVAAYLSALLGDWADCERQFAAGLAGVEAVGLRAMAARMRFELGDLMLRLRREPDRARALIAEGRAGAEARGLHELVALIDRRHPAGTSAPRARTASTKFSLVLEGEYYAVTTATGVSRFKASRGMQYLAALVERPNADLHVLELVGSSEQADRGDAGELLDPAAFRAYRSRLETLREALEHAEQIGDTGRAEQVRDEMDTIAGELSRATGKGGKARRAESAVDRARSAVQRRIKDALDRIAEQDPELGKWLRRAVHTGNYCSFRPDD